MEVASKIVPSARPKAYADHDAKGDADAECSRNRQARISTNDCTGLVNSVLGLLCYLSILPPGLLEDMPGISPNVAYHLASLRRQCGGPFLGLGRSVIHRIFCKFFGISHRVIPR